MPESPDKDAAEPQAEVVVLTDRERWYAAVGYVFVMCFFSLLKARESDFVRFHSRQAFLLFLAECAGLIAVLIVDRTIGRIPFLGLLVVVIVQAAVYISALFFSVAGFVKALFGERWVMPFLGRYSQHVPRI